MNFSIFKKFLILYLSFIPRILLPMDSELASIPAPKLPVASQQFLYSHTSPTLGTCTELQINTSEQLLDINSLKQQLLSHTQKLKSNIEDLDSITKLIEKDKKIDLCFLESFQFFTAISCISYAGSLIALFLTFYDPEMQKIALPSAVGVMSGTTVTTIIFGLSYKIHHKRQAILNKILAELITVQTNAITALNQLDSLCLGLSEQETLSRKLQISSRANIETTQVILKAQTELQNILPEIKTLET